MGSRTKVIGFRPSPALRRACEAEAGRQEISVGELARRLVEAGVTGKGMVLTTGGDREDGAGPRIVYDQE